MKTKRTKLARFIRPLLAGHVLAAFLAKTTAFAAGTIAFVATNGTPSPDGIGEISRAFPINPTIGPSLNNAGRAAFRAGLTGTGVGSTNDSGIFRGNAGNLTLIVREGQLAPDGTNRFGNFVPIASDVPALNDAGQVAFAATLYGPAIGTTNNTGIFRAQSASGIVTQIVRKGQLALDGNGRFGTFSSPAFNSSGQVALYATFTGTTDDRGIFRGDGTTLTQIARKNQIGPGGKFSGFEDPALNNAGQVAFLGFAGTNAVYRSDGRTLTMMAYQGQPLPDGSGNLYACWSTVALNDAGQVAFRNVIFPSNPSPGSGVFRADGATLTIIARTGQPTPDGSATFSSLKPGCATADTVGVALNNAGQVLFPAGLAGPGVGSTNDTGLLRGDGISANLRQIAREGQPAPDSSATFGNFSLLTAVAINDFGQVAFQANLLPGGQGIYFYDDDFGLFKVIRTGDPLLGSTVFDLRFSTSPRLGNEVDGLNNCGQVAFWFELANNREGIAIWSAHELRITSIELLGNDVRLTWNSLGCGTNFVQASPALTGASNNNFTNISGPIYIPAAGQQTSYLEIGGATIRPNRFYRICLLP